MGQPSSQPATPHRTQRQRGGTSTLAAAAAAAAAVTTHSGNNRLRRNRRRRNCLLLLLILLLVVLLVILLLLVGRWFTEDVATAAESLLHDLEENSYSHMSVTASSAAPRPPCTTSRSLRSAARAPCPRLTTWLAMTTATPAAAAEGEGIVTTGGTNRAPRAKYASWRC